LDQATLSMKLLRHIKRTSNGFTLVELMFAVGLIGIALFSSSALLIHSYAVLRRTDEKLYVTRLMESAIEMTRNLGFDELRGQSWPITFSTDYPVFPLYGKSVNPEANDDAQFGLKLENGQGTITAENISNDLTKVMVKVKWTPFRLREVSRTAVTYISRKGINKR